MRPKLRLIGTACAAFVGATAAVIGFSASADATSPRAVCVHNAMAAAPPAPGEYFLAACPGTRSNQVTLIGRGFPHGADMSWRSHRHDGVVLKRGQLKSDKAGAVQIDVSADPSATEYSIAVEGGFIAYTVAPGR